MATAITASQMIRFIDLATAHMLAGKSGFDEAVLYDGYGIGDPSQSDINNDWGQSKIARTMKTRLLGDGSTIYGITEPQIVTYLLKPIEALCTASDYRENVKANQQGLIRSMNYLGRLAGVNLSIPTTITNLATFLAYYNYGAGGPWNALVPPDFATVYNLVTQATLNPLNVYAPSTTFGSRAQGASFVDGSAVNTSLYAGAAVLKATTDVTWDVTGSVTITVTGNGFNSSGQAVTNRTWTVASSADGVQSLTLVPTVTGDICTNVTAIAVTGTWVAGTVTIISDVPTAPHSGRTNPPSDSTIS